VTTFFRIHFSAARCVATLAAAAAIWTLSGAAPEAKKIKLDSQHDKTGDAD
jgi:hypothetical protein